MGRQARHLVSRYPAVVANSAPGKKSCMEAMQAPAYGVCLQGDVTETAKTKPPSTGTTAPQALVPPRRPPASPELGRWGGTPQSTRPRQGPAVVPARISGRPRGTGRPQEPTAKEPAPRQPHPAGNLVPTDTDCATPCGGWRTTTSQPAPRGKYGSHRPRPGLGGKTNRPHNGRWLCSTPRTQTARTKGRPT